MVVIGINYSVIFHQMCHIIFMVMKIWSQKSFFIYKFLLPPNTTSPYGNALEWILWRKWDEWSWTSMAFKVAKRFLTKITLVFHFHYHCLLLPTKRTLSVISMSDDQWSDTGTWSKMKIPSNSFNELYRECANN